MSITMKGYVHGHVEVTHVLPRTEFNTWHWAETVWFDSTHYDHFKPLEIDCDGETARGMPIHGVCVERVYNQAYDFVIQQFLLTDGLASYPNVLESKGNIKTIFPDDPPAKGEILHNLETATLFFGASHGGGVDFHDGVYVSPPGDPNQRGPNHDITFDEVRQRMKLRQSRFVPQIPALSLVFIEACWSAGIKSEDTRLADAFNITAGCVDQAFLGEEDEGFPVRNAGWMRRFIKSLCNGSTVFQAMLDADVPEKFQQGEFVEMPGKLYALFHYGDKNKMNIFYKDPTVYGDTRTKIHGFYFAPKGTDGISNWWTLVDGNAHPPMPSL